MINGIITKNNPIKYIDPKGLKHVIKNSDESQNYTNNQSPEPKTPSLQANNQQSNDSDQGEILTDGGSPISSNKIEPKFSVNSPNKGRGYYGPEVSTPEVNPSDNNKGTLVVLIASFSKTDIGALALGVGGGIAFTLGAPVTGSILGLGAVGLIVYNNVIAPLRTIDKNVDKFKDIPGIKEHFHELEELDQSTGRKNY